MEKNKYEDKIKALEDEIEIMKERYRILEETTQGLLFEYLPKEDKMVFSYNFPDNKSRKEIENYTKFVKEKPLVHPEHLQKFLDTLFRACEEPEKGELEYLSKVSTGEFEWHKTYYSSIADQNGKIISVLGRIHNIHKSATERQKMEHRVETDSLTGLYNKETANQKISGWLKKYPTREARMIMLDLDNFKKINDVYGHSFGDEVLKRVSSVLKQCFNKNALIFRFGGDEFVVFVVDEPLGLVESRVDAMMQKITLEVREIEQPLQCSAGIASRASKYDDFEDLFNRADNAMYMAKKAGKNCYYVNRDIGN